MNGVPFNAMRDLRAGKITKDEYTAIMRLDARAQSAYEQYQYALTETERARIVARRA